MYTQCPECATVFPLSADALSISAGNVRCGSCGQVFFAVQSLSDSLDEDGQIPTCFHSDHPPTLNDPNSEAPPIDDLFWPSAAELPIAQPTTAMGQATDRPVGDELLPAGSPPTQQAGVSDDELERQFDQLIAGPDDPGPPDIDELSDIDIGDINDGPALEIESLLDAPIPEELVAAANNVDEKTAKSLDGDNTDPSTDAPISGVAFELAAERAARSRSRSSRLWGLWCAIAGLTLVGQWFAREHDQMARNASLEPWVARVCQVFGCRIELPIELDKIQLVSRSIEPHPSVEGALLISATLQNQAEFPQPHPVVEIAMADLSGRAVAMRRFLPAEYLENTDPQGMIPGHLLPLVFEVIDPGSNAVAFEFEFR